ncbi:hypothetical protein ATZ36_04670 [Candidatus Endomicrobiellum trichonymphae]|uniref:UvrD-like helicase C-terminal domain-containing protein n=1 Tax=Endomicrobium trichonymphae TaxID=1408204 RepID=A0A1E5IIR0_ENDTX|nr:hypothetical protein ATZ36_04670 [Candidatus Endomicrobium trichonymphae]
MYIAVTRAKKHLGFTMPEHNSGLRFNSLPEEINHSFGKNIISRFIIKAEVSVDTGLLNAEVSSAAV